MKSKVYSTLITLAATAVPPFGLLAYLCKGHEDHEILLGLGIYLLVHIGIWLALIPAFRKFPRSCWILCTLFYPTVALAGMLLPYSITNPSALPIALLWFGSLIYFPYGFLTIPVSGMSATIAYALIRNQHQTNNTDRGTAAPAP